MHMAQLPIPQKFSDFDTSYITDLATRHNLEYVAESKAAEGESSVFDNPNTNASQHYKLQMTVGGLKCEYYTVAYDYPWMKRTEEPYPPYVVQVFAVTLPYEIEDLYVESRTLTTLNNILGISSVNFTDSQRVQLEGDFNTFFRVYAPKGESINAFAILAPNIMSSLLATGGDYNFEFSGNKIYFYLSPKYFQQDKIALSRKQYDGLFTFGIATAKLAARAARPSYVEASPNQQKMWQLHNIKFTTKTILMAGLIMLLFFPAFFFWPITLLILFLRYRSFKSRKDRLIQNWQRSTAINA